MLPFIRSLISAAEGALPRTPPAREASPAPLSLITFPGSGQWPLWVAQDQGIDVACGVRLDIVDTQDSRQQMTSLIDGDHALAITAFDNVVAYHEGVGAPSRAPAPVVAVMGLDGGLLSLVARPEIDAVCDLKGKEVAVDALTTGYAFALQQTLREAGLNRDDCTLVSAGGADKRFEGIVAGRFAATLLMPPFVGMAQEQGLRTLVDVSRALGRYQGNVIAVRSDWAEDNAVRLTGYIAAHRRALAWLHDPAHREAALETYRRRLPDAPQKTAEADYLTLMDPVGGFWPDGDLDEAGLSAVLQMRTRYGPDGRSLGPVGRYVRRKYLAAAKLKHPAAIRQRLGKP